MVVTDESLERVVSECESKSDRFVVHGKTFNKQYAHFYSARLKAVKKNLLEAIEKKWGAGIPLREVSEIQCEEECIVIGTLFKHMELQPSILKELSEEHELGLLESERERYCTDQDQLFIEDGVQRIALSGHLLAKDNVTGVVMAVRGIEKEDEPGVLLVTDSCMPRMEPPPVVDPLSDDRYVLLVSGLGFGSKTDVPLSRDLLLDYILGNLCDPSTDSPSSGSLPSTTLITRVIVAGNSLHSDTEDKGSLTMAKYLTKNLVAGTVSATKELDSYLSSIAASVQLDVMPGAFDPSNHQLPQQPLHPCMLPLTMKGAATPTTNPYECSIEGIRILGTSGQPITNILQYSELSDPLTALEKTLQWSHLAPTSPDTLDAYPFKDSDPFIIQQCPHVYFAANQTEFGFKTYTDPSFKQQVSLICIPSFHLTHSAVLLNLKTLSADLLTFDCTSSIGDGAQLSEGTAGLAGKMDT